MLELKQVHLHRCVIYYMLLNTIFNQEHTVRVVVAVAGAVRLPQDAYVGICSCLWTGAAVYADVSWAW